MSARSGMRSNTRSGARSVTFSLARWWSIVRKEFLQLLRDPVTLRMITVIPVMQMLLFGYAINSDPKHMPTAIIAADHSDITRTFIAAMKASDYFDVVDELPNEESGRAALAQGKVLFVLSIPANFTRNVLRGEQPTLLVEADATDPTATAQALAALPQLVQSVSNKDLKGALEKFSNNSKPAFEVQVHRLYNPEGINQYNVVPGLMGVVLSMTLVMMTGLAMTRERERGTMENMLATPVTPIEVITGKIMPYIAIGLLQSSIILLGAYFIFHVPFAGSIIAIYLAALLFIGASLTVGITLSSLAQNQLQAMQLTMFYFLPNMLLSGFMFPFQGMPKWAQFIGNLLPLTYFNRLIRGILLKGNGLVDLWPSVWPLLLFTLLVMVIAVRFYRRTLD
ncbi:ABC transporter permease [Glaciimonas sp. GG7]